MNAFALTLDTAEAFSEAFVSEKDASLSDANEFDLIFYEDFEGFTAPTKIVTGGFAPVTTEARIDYIGGNWMDFSEKFYIYAVDSYPGLTVLTDSMSGTNKALHMDRFANASS